ILSITQDHEYWLLVAKHNRQKGINNGFILLGIECNLRGEWKWSDGSPIGFKPANFNPAILEACDNANSPSANRCMWAIDPVSANWEQYCADHSVDIYCLVPP
ncbi:hypothetical protein PMAYCL1PPCAC_14994, partial [Pristionchus mayeri]